MITFEGTMHVKPHKNLFGKKTPLTIDCENKKELNVELARIKSAFMADGAYRVVFDLSERK